MATSLPIVCAVAVCASAATAGTVPQFTPLGFLNDSGFRFSQVNGISEDGSTVIGISSRVDDSSPSCFRWSPGGPLIGLPDLASGPNAAEVFGVSANGSRVVGTGTIALQPSGEVVNRPVRWTGSTPGSLPPVSGGRGATGNGISGDGLVVVGSTAIQGSTPLRAVRWVGTTPEMFTYTSGPFAGNAVGGAGIGANWDGSVVAGREGGTNWIWRQGVGAATLTLPDAYMSGTLTDLSPDGNATLFHLRPWSGEGFLAGVMVNGVVTEMARLPGSTGMYGATMTADYTTVAGVASTTFGERAVLMRADGAVLMKSVLEDAGLDLTGWTLTSCTVSADGQAFAGSGVGPDGRTQAWYATIPAPASLVPIACVALAVRRRRR